MRKAERALVELTAWLTTSTTEFFHKVPPRHELGSRLVTLDPRELDPAFAPTGLYRVELFPDVLTTTPYGLLPPGYDADAEVKYTFAIWSRTYGDPDRASEIPDEMWRKVTADLFTYRSQGIGRKQFARLAAILEARIPGHEFQHLTTLACEGELVSVFVDLESMKRVARVIE